MVDGTICMVDPNNEDYLQVMTPCCGSYSTYSEEGYLVCRNCYQEVRMGEGDGSMYLTEEELRNLREKKLTRDASRKEEEMKFELKAVKIAKHLSRETEAFSASLYLNGKRIAVVSNCGQGGPNEFDFICKEGRKAFYAFAKENNPDAIEPDEYVIADLLDEYEHTQWIKRQTRTKVLFRIEGDSPDAYRTIALNATKKRAGCTRERALQWINEEYGTRVIEVLA